MADMNYLAAIIIPLYLLLTVGLMAFIGRGTKGNLKDYTLGGKALPWYVTSGSMIASLIGGGTLMGYVGYYYQFGIEWGWMGVGCGLTLLFMGLKIAPRIKKLNLNSVAEIFAMRYDSKTRIVASILIMIGDFAVFCAMISSFATLLSGYVGLSHTAAMVLAIVVFILSTFLGGFKGIAYTDLIQSILILVGVVAVGVFAFFKAGAVEGFATLPEGMLNPFSGNIPGFTMVGNVIALVGMFFVSQSTVIQKVNASRSPKDAKKAMIMFAVSTGFAMLVFIGSMGLSSRVIFGDGITNSDDVIVHLLGAVPPLLGAIYAAAIVAAVLTTANAMLMSSGLCFANDIIGIMKPNMPEKKKVLVTRTYIVLASVVGYILVEYIPSIITWIMLAYTIQNAMILPMYAGLMSKRISSRTGFLSLLISGIAILIWELTGEPMGIHPIFVGLAASIVVLIVSAAFDKAPLSARQSALVYAYTNNVDFVDPEAKAQEK